LKLERDDRDPVRNRWLPDTLFRHYRELVKPDKARLFWEIAPALESSRAVVRRLKVA